MIVILMMMIITTTSNSNNHDHNERAEAVDAEKRPWSAALGPEAGPDGNAASSRSGAAASERSGQPA